MARFHRSNCRKTVDGVLCPFAVQRVQTFGVNDPHVGDTLTKFTRRSGSNPTTPPPPPKE